MPWPCFLSIFLPSPPDVQPADMDLCSLVQAGPHQKAPFCVAFGCVCGSVTACIGRVSSPPSRTPVWRVGVSCRLLRPFTPRILPHFRAVFRRVWGNIEVCSAMQRLWAVSGVWLPPHAAIPPRQGGGGSTQNPFVCLSFVWCCVCVRVCVDGVACGVLCHFLGCFVQ